MMKYMESVEDLKNYDFERPYLEQEPNETRYYVEGKGVVLLENGGLLWFDLPEEDMGFFAFSEMVLNQYLEGEFTDRELQALRMIRTLDEQAQEDGLYVITTTADEKTQYAVFYCPESEAYFQVDFDEIDWLNKATVEGMRQYAPCRLDESYSIHLKEDGTIQA